ncbi:MAG: hypothetical protein AAFP26_08365 [Planctomycetota bacterium]
MPTSPTRDTDAHAARFGLGDRVIHTAKPEWGVGTVATASAITLDAKPTQRLQNRFDSGGLKTLITAHAPIALAGTTPAPTTNDNAKTGAAPKAPAHKTVSIDVPEDPIEAKAHLRRLPDDAADPFATPLQRLEATLRAYRFDMSGPGLIEWAVAQTGLADPLSRFSRHELEEIFRQHTNALDTHLRSLVKEVRDVPPADLVRVRDAAPPRAREALKRVHRLG